MDLDELRNMIIAANPGDIIKWNVGTALPLDIMKLIAEKDVILEFSYTYEGNDYVVIINLGMDRFTSLLFLGTETLQVSMLYKTVIL